MLRGRIIAISLVILCCVCLTSCASDSGKGSKDEMRTLPGQEEEYDLNYDNAKDFEAALNDGEDTVGKTVQFEVKEVHPDSALGYNLWAGEHLNFVGDDAKEAKEGDSLTVLVRSVKKRLGSWVIKYELLDLETFAQKIQLETTNSTSESQKETSSETAFTEPKEIKVVSLQISGEKSVKVGATISLKAEISPMDATDQSVIWESDNTDIITIDGNGVVTGINPGRANVVAVSSDPEITDSIEIEVLPIEVMSLSLTEEVDPLEIGQTVVLSATVSPENATDQTVSWKSDNPEIASVDENGTVYAENAGTAVITASSVNGVSAAVEVQVIGPLVSFKVYPKYTVIESNSVGNDWDMGKVMINGEEIGYGGEFSAHEGDVITVAFEIVEFDKDSSDVGTFKQEVTIPSVEIGSGFHCDGETTVIEDKGRYKGNHASISCQVNFARQE